VTLDLKIKTPTYHREMKMQKRGRGRPRKVTLKYAVDDVTKYSPNEQPVEYWLQTMKNKHTRYMYQVRFEDFERFTNKDGRTMLQERMKDVASGDLERAKRYDKIVIDFYEVTTKRFKSGHTAWSYLTAIRSFFATFGKHMELVLHQYLGRAGKTKPQRTTRKHKFVLAELRDLYDVADWYEKTMLILGVQCGLARKEVVTLKIEELKPWLNIGAPVGPIELVREKTDTPLFMVLGKDAVETLRTYIGDRTSGWLFPSPQNEGKHITTSEPGRILQRLWKRLPKGKYLARGRIMYHALRDFFSNAMQNGGMPFHHVELLMAHSLPQGGAYTTPTDEMLLEEYRKAEANVTIRTVAPAYERLERLERENKALREELNDLKEFTHRLAPRMMKLRKKKG